MARAQRGNPGLNWGWSGSELPVGKGGWVFGSSRAGTLHLSSCFPENSVVIRLPTDLASFLEDGAFNQMKPASWTFQQSSSRGWFPLTPHRARNALAPYILEVLREGLRWGELAPVGVEVLWTPCKEGGSREREVLRLPRHLLVRDLQSWFESSMLTRVSLLLLWGLESNDLGLCCCVSWAQSTPRLSLYMPTSQTHLCVPYLTPFLYWFHPGWSLGSPPGLMDQQIRDYKALWRGQFTCYTEICWMEEGKDKKKVIVQNVVIRFQVLRVSLPTQFRKGKCWCLSIIRTVNYLVSSVQCPLDLLLDSEDCLI